MGLGKVMMLSTFVWSTVLKGCLNVVLECMNSTLLHMYPFCPSLLY